MLLRRAPGPATPTLAGLVALGVLLTGCSTPGDAASTRTVVASDSPAVPPATGTTPEPEPGAGGATGATGAASAASSTSAGPFTPRRSDLAAIEAMLRRRAQAVLGHDRTAFLATVDDRDPALLAQQGRLFDNLRRLRLAAFAYETGTDVLAPDAVRGLQDGDAVLRVATVEHVQLADTFAAPLGNPTRMTYVRRDGRWLLGRETRSPVRDGALAQPRPWFGVPVAVADRGALVVLADDADGDLAARLAAIVEAGLRFDARLLALDPRRDLLVDATSNGRGVHLNSLDDQEAAALYSDVWELDARGRAGRRAGGAVRVNPALSAAQLTEDPGLVRHELTHFLLREHAATAPLWASEGIAEYARWSPLRLADLRVPPAMWRRLREAPRDLPTSGLFHLDPAVNYLLAQGAVQVLLERGGTVRFLSLLERYRVEGAAPGPGGDELTATLLRESYGISTSQLEREMWEAVSRLEH